MAAVIGDFVSDSHSHSRFHTMIANSLQHQHQHSHDRSVSRSRQQNSQNSQDTQNNSNTTPRPQRPEPSWWSSTGSSAGQNQIQAQTQTQTQTQTQSQSQAHVSTNGGASRFPSPPPSSSPRVATGPPAAALDDGNSASMASVVRDSVPVGQSAQRTSTSTGATSTAATRPGQQQPSPASDDFQISRAPPYPQSVTPGPSQAPSSSRQTVIHIRDLAHIQSLANADQLSGNSAGILNDPPLQQMKYEISGMPINDIIEMVAALLTKITTTNDLQHDAMQRNATHQQQANQTLDSSDITPLNHSVLAFHGKNVPAITILSYLSRIHKYCPTTYEVFLSLLVYFDRMTERVNDIVSKSEEARRQAEAATSNVAPSAAQPSEDTPMRDDSSDDSVATDSDLVDTDEDMEDHSSHPSVEGPSGRIRRRGVSADGHSDLVAATYFVVDSFNIHRLIISGVTCASKFFSDVFYTNSRYAKVGGLPLVELNHLELQFLLLNDFRLAVPVEDLEAYATMLVEFYAREVVAKKSSTGASE